MDDAHRDARDAVDALAVRLAESEERVTRLRAAMPCEEDLKYHMLQLVAGRPVYLTEEPPLGDRLAVRGIDGAEDYLESLSNDLGDLEDGDL